MGGGIEEIREGSSAAGQTEAEKEESEGVYMRVSHIERIMSNALEEDGKSDRKEEAEKSGQDAEHEEQEMQHREQNKEGEEETDVLRKEYVKKHRENTVSHAREDFE